MEDELRPEYDLKSLRIRRVGAERKTFRGILISLEPDVAAVFPDNATVNAALRSLIKERSLVGTASLGAVTD